MDYNIDKKNSGISDDELLSLTQNYNIQFPHSYIDFLRYSNGFQSINSDLIYSSEEIKERNQYYEIDKYMPNYLAIGDGDGEYVYLMKRSMLSKKIFMYDSISIAINNCLPECVFENFHSFINFIVKDRFVEENDKIDCYSISLTKPVSDIKLIVKMKRVFNYNGDLKSLLNGCKSVPFILKENITFGMCQVLMKQIPEISESIEIKK
ncbi:MAG: SMI1/KNR4 family protein [Clostridium sp.]|nr:SMI1/KNR4 family protein [Clostridium sp.]